MFSGQVDNYGYGYKTRRGLINTMTTTIKNFLDDLGCSIHIFKFFDGE
jgi:hypothetical protein